MITWQASPSFSNIHEYMPMTGGGVKLLEEAHKPLPWWTSQLNLTSLAKTVEWFQAAAVLSSWPDNQTQEHQSILLRDGSSLVSHTLQTGAPLVPGRAPAISHPPHCTAGIWQRFLEYSSLQVCAASWWGKCCSLSVMARYTAFSCLAMVQFNCDLSALNLY